MPKTEAFALFDGRTKKLSAAAYAGCSSVTDETVELGLHLFVGGQGRIHALAGGHCVNVGSVSFAVLLRHKVVYVSLLLGGHIINVG